jgi:glucose/mannose transport system permease protein
MTRNASRKLPRMQGQRFADRWLPKIVLSPSVLLCLVFVYGFIAITFGLSFTESRLLPNWTWAGTERYAQLFDNDRWWTSLKNLGIYGTLFIGFTLAVGILLAILLDQRIRAEGFLRAAFLYPMALSFIVTGTAWKWILNPSIGIEKVVQGWGFPNFKFDWITDPDMAIYTVVIAAVWQSSGFVMALFLAGLRGVDNEILEAAQVDGANAVTTYRKVVLPMLVPVFFSSLLILAHIAIKSFDLVMALTSGGPGTATDLPAIFMYQFSFNRGQLGVGAASSVMMLMTVVAVIVPLMYIGSRKTNVS